MAPRKHRRRLTHMRVHAASIEEKRPRGGGQKGTPEVRGEAEREREGGTHRRRQQIANERMGAFETRCKVPPGLVVHFAVKLSSRSGRHGTARHGTARVRHIATAAAVVSSPTKFVALSANFQTHRPKLTAVRITLFPSENKGDSTQMRDLTLAE